MNCSDFENKITAFIDGDLVKTRRTEFVTHRKECSSCSKKFDSVKSLVKSLSEVKSITTSANFMTNLLCKIEESRFTKLPLYKRIIKSTPFGFKPLHATGFVVACFAIITTTLLLLSKDTLPTIDTHKFTEKKKQIQNDFNHPVLFAADYDTTSEDSIDFKNRQRFDDKIIVVNKNK